MASVTRLYSFVLACALLSAPASAQKRPFTFDEMMKVKRVADPQLSPDGKWVTFTVTAYDVEKQQPQQRHLACPVGRRRAPANDAQSQSRRACALGSRQQTLRVCLDPFRDLTNLDPHD